MKHPLRVRTQLALLCAAFILMLMALGGMGLWRAMQQSNAMQSLYLDRVIPLKQIKTVSDMYAVNMVDTAHKFADGTLSPAEASDALRQAQQTIQTEWSAYLSTYLVPEEVRLVEKLKPLMAAADGTVPGLMRQFQAGDREGVGAFTAKTMYPIFDPMQGVIGELMALQLDVSRQMHEASQAGVDSLVLGSLAGTVGAIVLGAAATAWITWRLTHDLGAEPHEVRQVAEAVAHGDLTRSITVRKGFDASVMAAMKRMNEHLQGVVAEVRHNADSVSIASREIAQGNQDLSQRSEQQASSLQQTAASMEQLAATVKNNAEHAVLASQLAQSATSDVRAGGDAVTQVVQSMQAIDQASSRITDIVGVIDGIAFQTNILALNAAVEAARAGEMGRGFAVVAGEVRLLAQRSATAAKEVRDLIHGSHNEVEKGTELASRAGETVLHSVEAIQRLSQLVVEISTATREQNNGLDQITVAVSHMDHTTQQNAALVEQSAAAAASLRSQAERLVQSVATFRLPQTQRA